MRPASPGSSQGKNKAEPSKNNNDKKSDNKPTATKTEKKQEGQSSTEKEPIQDNDAVHDSDNATTWARKMVGDVKYGQKNNLNIWWPDGVNKCNKFVVDAFNKGSGKTIIEDGWRGANPPTAANFYDGIVPGFTETKNPKPGDICTTTHHIGIVSGSGTTISASSKDNKIVENDWGFRNEQGNGGDVKFYRYVGK